MSPTRERDSLDLSSPPSGPTPGPVDPRHARPAEARREAAEPPSAAPEALQNVPLRRLESEVPEEDPLLPKTRRRGAGWGLALAALTGFLLLLAGYTSVQTIQQAYLDNPLLGGLLAAAGLGVLALGGLATWRELAALRRLRHAGHLRAEIETARLAGDTPRLLRSLAPLLDRLSQRQPQAVERFRRSVASEDAPERVLARLEREVLEPLDREARAVTRRLALQTAAVGTISPHPGLDLVLVVWRSLVLVRRVAEVYGMRPAGLGTLKLFGQALLSGAIAAGADALGDAAIDIVGEGMLQRLTKHVGEAGVIALRMSRLGLRTMALCRAVPPRRAADS